MIQCAGGGENSVDFEADIVIQLTSEAVLIIENLVFKLDVFEGPRGSASR